MSKSFTVLHLNIERDRHIKSTHDLIISRTPDVVCLEEAMENNVKDLASEFDYHYVYSPLVSVYRGETFVDQEGSAILSKFPIIEKNIFPYGKHTPGEPPHYDPYVLLSAYNRRTSERYGYHYAVLLAKVQLESGEMINITTTHFPVVDHQTPEHEDHVLDKIERVDEIDLFRTYFDQFINIIKNLKSPLVFTADMNNQRGEFIYDTLAHTLDDLTPKNIDSTIDPLIHRRKDLKLVVDTIMISSDLQSNEAEIIEGISDHKALLAHIFLA